MLKVGTKRRRTTKQVKADKEEAAIREVGNQEKQDKIAHLEELAENNQTAANILTDLVQKGIAVLDKNGEIQIPSASKIKPRQSSEGNPNK